MTTRCDRPPRGRTSEGARWACVGRAPQNLPPAPVGGAAVPDGRHEWARLARADAARREARRAAAEARAHQQAAVQQLDQRGLVERKEAARREYRAALAAARGPIERRAAATRWLATVDQLNR